MKTKQTTTLFLTITLGVVFSSAAQTPQPSAIPRAEAVFDPVEKFATKPPRNTKVFVALLGQVLPCLRQELEVRERQVKERVTPGPLKQTM